MYACVFVILHGTARTCIGFANIDILAVDFSNSEIRCHFFVTECLIFQHGMLDIQYNLQLLVGDYVCCECLALFPGLPRFCSSVCVRYNTRKRKSDEKRNGEGLGTLTWRE